jgi:hypothetical protein
MMSNDFKMRHAKLSDLERLLELEVICWSPHLRSDANLITSRISTFPSGQYVLEVCGEVCGVLYTQRVSSVEALRAGKHESQLSLHDPLGPVWQLVSINVDVKKAPNGALHIREHAIQVAKSDPTVSCLAAMTRCSRFQTHTHTHTQRGTEERGTEKGVIGQGPDADKDKDRAELEKEYLDYVFALRDPTIFFHSQGRKQLFFLFFFIFTFFSFSLC